jgi:hypothetical protein
MQVPPYDRDAFGYGWADTDRDSQDTRQEILIRDQVDVALTADRLRRRDRLAERPLNRNDNRIPAPT